MFRRTYFCWCMVFCTALYSWADEPELLEAPIEAGDREHWAFQSLQRPAVPKLTEMHQARSPLDCFVLEKLQAQGLDLSPEADRPTLLRRVTFDLTGLPPTLEELAAFERDPSPLAYEHVVDRLLHSPAYGERIAQHWLDLARFAETDGFEHDKVRPEAWRYRDWVIQAFNHDLPYCDFVVHQIAGDELSPDLVVATSFGLAGPDMPDVNDQAERRHNRLNELTGTMGSVFLGLQLGCAECHDHKYDPISQADFYRLRAIFEPAVPILMRDVPYTSFTRTHTIAEQPARFWIRGNHRRPGAIVAAAWPRIALVQASASERSPAGSTTRLQFARQLIDGSAPLTARVIVNRLWQWHFQRGLCATSSDFGVINAGPTHPELLDWLACELIDQNWSLKSLQRQIVLSATYRQTSYRTEEATDWERRLAVDPDGRWLSRQQLRRLSGEEIRDAALLVTGNLNEIPGGPGVRPPLPSELVQTLLKGQWVISENPADYTRRSVYLFARRNLRYPLFDVFDRPDANASCAVRGRSTTAPQALTLINGELWQQLATTLAERVLSGSSHPEQRVCDLYRRTYGRNPTSSETRMLLEFIAQHQSFIGRTEGDSASDAERLAWADACLAILNSSEFLYVD